MLLSIFLCWSQKNFHHVPKNEEFCVYKKWTSCMWIKILLRKRRRKKMVIWRSFKIFGMVSVTPFYCSRIYHLFPIEVEKSRKRKNKVFRNQWRKTTDTSLDLILGAIYFDPPYYKYVASKWSWFRNGADVLWKWNQNRWTSAAALVAQRHKFLSNQEFRRKCLPHPQCQLMQSSCFQKKKSLNQT